MTAPAAERQMPSYAQVSRYLNTVMTERGEWCGVPMPIEGLRLILDKKYPHPELADFFAKAEPPHTPDPDDDEIVIDIVNRWRDRYHDCHVMLIRTKDSAGVERTRHILLRQNTRAGESFALHRASLEASEAYDVDAEAMALDLLYSLIGEHRTRQYIFRGCFIERSKRSGVLYMFRKGRPTIAFRLLNKRGLECTADEPGHEHVLAALCLHPIAYYDRTFAGAMTPTDDVIAHLSLMRGDEHMLWRRANQHHIDSPEAAL